MVVIRGLLVAVVPLSIMDYQFFLLNLCDLVLSNDTCSGDGLLEKYTTEFGGPSFLAANMLKDRGNAFFKEGNISSAVLHYKMALQYLCFLGLPPLSDQPKASSLALSSILNLAFCELKQKHFTKVLLYCSFVLTFEPSNAKALYRRGLASKHLHYLTEALADFELASKLDPNSKDIARELTWVVEELTQNINGKRLVPPFDPLGSHKKSRKPDVSYSASGKCIPPSVTDVPTLQETGDSPPPVHPDLTPSMPLDSESCSAIEENLLGTSTTTSSPPSKPHFISFTNQKNTHCRLKLSAHDYNDLLHGKNLGYFHPRSTSFLRIRTLTPKTIQTGTPQDEISGSAEVPPSPPSLQERVPSSTFTCNVDTIVQEEVVLQISKKQRMTSTSAQVSAACTAPFQFISVGETRNRNPKRKGRFSLPHSCGVHTTPTPLRKRSLVSFDFSLSFCRFTKKEAVTRAAKRKDTSLFNFDPQFHPPKKKYRCSFLVSRSCTVNSVSCFSNFLLDSGVSGFVL